MKQKGGYDDPDRTKQQEQLCGHHEIDDEIAVGYARKHLWSRQRHKQAITLQTFHKSTTCRERSGRLNAGNDACGTKQDEAAQDHYRTITPVDPPAEHQQADDSNGNHSDDSCDRPEQGALHPPRRPNDRARPLRVSKVLRMCDASRLYYRDNEASLGLPIQRLDTQTRLLNESVN